MTQAFFLSAEDVVVMRQVVDWFRKSHGEIPQPEPISAFQSPDVYIAKVPSTGIDALDGSTPGSKECDLYRIQDGEMSSMGITRTIYNLSINAIAESYVLVTKTKGGSWIASTGGGGDSMKKFCVFELDEDITESMASAQATIVTEYGPGLTHLDETGTSDETITVLNPAEGTEGTYMFYGDVGFKGIATYHSSNEWLIVQLFRSCAGTAS